ncbi:MAG: PAS domain S-box protein [Ardenticatenaceae bacterium]|nr:PAS domain S-box protein [Ardenticatenaceae bacterium]
MNQPGSNQNEKLQNLQAELIATQVRLAHNKQTVVDLHHKIEEYKQAEQTHRFYRRFQRLITSISTRFISLPSNEIDEGINQAMAGIGIFTGVDRVDLFQIHEGGETASQTHQWCASGIARSMDNLQSVALADFPWFAPKFIAGEAIVFQSLADLPPEAAAVRRAFAAEKTVSSANVPLIYGNEVIGLIAYDSVRQERAWPDELVDLLRFTGEIFAYALKRKEMEMALRDSEARFSGILDIAADAIISVDVEQNIIIFNKGAERIFGYTADEVLGRPLDILIPGEWREKHRWHVDTFALSADSAREMSARQEIVGCRQNGDFFPAEASISKIEIGGQRILTAILRDITRRKQAQAALEEAQEMLEQRVAARTAELSTLLDISQEMTTTLELESLLKLILDHLNHVIENTGVSIMILEGEKLVMKAYRGEGQQAEALPLKFSLLDYPPLQEIIHQNRPLIVADLHHDGPLAATLQSIDRSLEGDVTIADYFRACLCVPLTVNKQTIGLLVLNHQEPDFYREEDAKLAQTFANQAAIAIENARLHEQTKKTAVVEERHRLARELHDSVTQSLYSLTLLTAGWQQLTKNGDLNDLQAPLQEIGEIAQQALKEMRLLVYQLRPPELDREGLVGALRQRLEAVEKRAGLEARLITDELVSLPPQIEEALYAIALETLNNALKHAQATAVRVQIRSDDGWVALDVMDNGRGFAVDEATQSGGMGLANIRERVENCGGELAIDASPETGTRIQVKINIGQEDSP